MNKEGDLIIYFSKVGTTNGAYLLFEELLDFKEYNSVKKAESLNYHCDEFLQDDSLKLMSYYGFTASQWDYCYIFSFASPEIMDACL